MKILVTGGHLTPALSFIDWVNKNQPKDKFIYVGRKYSQDLLKQESVEQYELDKRDIKFIPFKAVKLGKQFLLKPFGGISGFFKSVKAAKKIIKEENISVVVSFGGYLGVPFALAAYLKKVPVITHEQTLTVGVANRIIGFFANKIAVSFKETAKSFRADKVAVTGNLLRRGVFLKQQAQPKWFKKDDKPLLLVMGGNQGAKVLNELILNNLPDLVKDWTIVHQCGRPNLERDYKKVFEVAKTHLPKNDQDSLYVREWIDDKDLFWLYRNSTAALSRAGANATQELAVAGLPTIFVPLPYAHHDEQYKNAKWLVDQGAAIIIDQSALNKDSLVEALTKLTSMNKEMRKALDSLKIPSNSSEKLYELVKEVTTKS
jgi:UDP-N-acetylglucosamine--N-acetylmuramyl-(pentapeptide) pyrophosphoryl-undecaprenol N-acetylglucosamine transferase